MELNYKNSGVDVEKGNMFVDIIKDTCKNGKIGGFSGIYDNIEVIKELQIYVTLFVITNSIDDVGFLSKNQLIDLSLLPYINIQSDQQNKSPTCCR